MEMSITAMVETHLYRLGRALNHHQEQRDEFVTAFQNGNLEEEIGEAEYCKEVRTFDRTIKAVRIEYEKLIEFMAEQATSHREPDSTYFKDYRIDVKPCLTAKKVKKANFIVWTTVAKKMEFFLFNQRLRKGGELLDFRITAKPSYKGSYVVSEVRNKEGMMANFRKWPTFADKKLITGEKALITGVDDDDLDDRFYEYIRISQFVSSAFAAVLRTSYEREAVAGVDHDFQLEKCE